MRAALYRQTGDSSVLGVEEIPAPDPGPGYVRVRIACSGINPTDWKSRSGLTGSDPEDFQVPHHDGAGTIDAVGEDVEGLALQERVWLRLAAFQNRYGTAAECSVLPASRVEPLPEAASFELGACLGVPAVTAARCLGGNPAALAGKAVLVAGGAGAVGHYAIELARHAGARVAATASSEEKAQLARDAGAELVVNYKDPGAAQELKAFATEFDRIVELALGANLDLDLAVSGPPTTIAVYAREASDPTLPTRRLMAANVTLVFVLLYSVPKRQLACCSAWVGNALADAALSTLPLHTFPLERIGDAQDAVEGGAVGKVLVLPG